jgi:hypothetical protein
VSFLFLNLCLGKGGWCCRRDREEMSSLLKETGIEMCRRMEWMTKREKKVLT